MANVEQIEQLIVGAIDFIKTSESLDGYDAHRELDFAITLLEKVKILLKELKSHELF
jgi:hypothetical protein